ncbi:YfhD family protein [Paenibacillus sp. YPG26]|uniref:YfhD family protein n=1 Tax=Paenibacillus sp. YPG26 TaxID=2878915 RepID=UPI00203F99BF|nr:YfhD family protein [Paenibacillus sp. YPG26]USB34436.1 YfhD family protein [Paenibacillus sp. YPG26]
MNKKPAYIKRFTGKIPQNLKGSYLDVEFSEERADQEDWEALQRSERADARQHGNRLV